jgi:hypothetical protein
MDIWFKYNIKSFPAKAFHNYRFQIVNTPISLPAQCTETETEFGSGNLKNALLLLLTSTV